MVTFYKREPVSHETMLECRSAQPNSICNILSQIYFAVEDEKVKKNCRRAVRIAKAMSARLKKYGDG